MRKNLYYYVRVVGKPYSFGRACKDVLTARIRLSEAMRCYPSEQWQIDEICA